MKVMIKRTDIKMQTENAIKLLGDKFLSLVKIDKVDTLN